MKDRILEFLKGENKTSAQLAEEIHVQPSGISHIISGRNKPSLDFVVKMLEKYTFLSTEWLLFGKGSMYKKPEMGDLFANNDLRKSEKLSENQPENEQFYLPEDKHKPINREISDQKSPQGNSHAVKCVWFYDDYSFEEFYPLKH